MPLEGGDKTLRLELLVPLSPRIPRRDRGEVSVSMSASPSEPSSESSELLTFPSSSGESRRSMAMAGTILLLSPTSSQVM